MPINKLETRLGGILSSLTEMSHSTSPPTFHCFPRLQRTSRHLSRETITSTMLTRAAFPALFFTRGSLFL